MKLLALDLATKVGYAVDGESVCPPRCGSWDNPRFGLGLGAGLLRYSEFLCSLLDTYEPGIVCAEAPVMGGHGMVMTAETVQKLVGLFTTTALVAASYDLRFEQAHVQKVRAHFIGQGRPKNPKKAVMERCRLLGWEPSNHDAADAAALWAWGKATYDKSFRLEQSTPLFSGEKDRDQDAEKSLRTIF